MAARGLANGKYQGAKWIRREKRLAIYLRDGMACVYCGIPIEDGAGLTLDHIVHGRDGGNNDEANLITACGKCNSSRASRSIGEFAESVAGYLNRGLTADQIMAHVEKCLERPIDVSAAKAIIARRGSWRAVLRGDK